MISAGISKLNDSRILSGTCSGILKPIFLRFRKYTSSVTTIEIRIALNMPVPPKNDAGNFPSTMGAEINRKVIKDSIPTDKPSNL